MSATALMGLGAALVGCASRGVPAGEPRRTPTPEASRRAEPDPATGAGSTVEPMLLLASLAHSDRVAIIDPSRSDASAVVGEVRVGAAPWGVGVSPDGRTGYAATAEGLAVFDLRALQGGSGASVLRERAALVPYSHPAPTISSGEYRPGGLGLAVAPDGSKVFVATTVGGSAPGSSTLDVFDTESGEFVGSVPVGARPFDVLVAPDGTWVATVDHDGFTITVIDTDTLQARQHTVAPFGTEGGLASWEKPHYGAVDANGMILLPYQGRIVAKLDPWSGRYTTIESAADSHSHGTARAGTRLLTVGTGAFGNARGTSNLSVLDLASGAEQIVPLEVPHETVTVWRDLGWDGITLISLGSVAEVAEGAEGAEDAPEVDAAKATSGEVGRTTREIPVPGYPQVVIGFTRS